VRDNIHSHDVVRAIEEFAANPRPGEVYNLGGGRANSISMLEAIERIEQMTGRKLDWHYVDEARKGDHICYISNLGKIQNHYPSWKITRGLDAILEEIIASATRAVWRRPRRDDHGLIPVIEKAIVSLWSRIFPLPSGDGLKSVPATRGRGSGSVWRRHSALLPSQSISLFV